MSTAQVTIEEMRDDDWERVRAIYLEGIATGDATFETDAPQFEAWDAAHLHACRIVARTGDEVAGWAALSPVSSRCVYGGVAEVSVYVAERARGRGLGRALLASLVEASERAGLWTLQAGVLAENEASIRLHEACGFHVIGKRERLGKLKGVWRDVVLLERRSAVVGRD
jgi:phosphinothricin acetyltransferase